MLLVSRTTANCRKVPGSRGGVMTDFALLAVRAVAAW
jgi:hypothetical protein